VQHRHKNGGNTQSRRVYGLSDLSYSQQVRQRRNLTLVKRGRHPVSRVGAATTSRRESLVRRFGAKWGRLFWVSHSCNGADLTTAPFSLRASGWFPGGDSVRIIAAMDDRTVRQARRGVLDDLVATRADLIEIYMRILRKLDHARSSQWIAATAGFGALAVMHDGGDGAPPTPALLASSIRQIESEVTHIRGLLAHVDARLTQVASAGPLTFH
jgi:hypothetical protein